MCMCMFVYVHMVCVFVILCNEGLVFAFDYTACFLTYTCQKFNIRVFYTLFNSRVLFYYTLHIVTFIEP